MSALSLWLIALLYVAGAALAFDLTLRACAMEGLPRPRGPVLGLITAAWPLVAVTLALLRLARGK